MRAVLDSISEDYRYLYKLNLNSTGSYRVVEDVGAASWAKLRFHFSGVEKLLPVLHKNYV
jgi:hypothetical protein